MSNGGEKKQQLLTTKLQRCRPIRSAPQLIICQKALRAFSRYRDQRTGNHFASAHIGTATRAESEFAQNVGHRVRTEV